MKRAPFLLLALLALVVVGRLLPSRVAASDPRLRQHGGVLTRDGVAYTGTVVERAADGRVTATTSWRNGLRDGEQLRFDRDGSVLERRTWAAGQREGTHAGWFAGSGRPRFCYVFEHDLNHGPAYEWADLPGSPVTARFEFDHGTEVGMQRVWRVDGIVRANYLASGNDRFGLRGKKECSR